MCAVRLASLMVCTGSCREYEKAVLYKETPGTKEAERQADRVRSLFTRQLSQPLSDVDDIAAEYAAWEQSQGKVCSSPRTAHRSLTLGRFLFKTSTK